MVAQTDINELEEKLAGMRKGETEDTLKKGKACNEMLQEILDIVRRIDERVDVIERIFRL